MFLNRGTDMINKNYKYFKKVSLPHSSCSPLKVNNYAIHINYLFT